MELLKTGEKIATTGQTKDLGLIKDLGVVMLKGPVLTKALGLGLIKDLILGVVMIKGPVLTKALDLGQTKDLILGVEVKGVPGQRTPRMIATPINRCHHQVK
jgi:hypothetical protein